MSSSNPPPAEGAFRPEQQSEVRQPADDLFAGLLASVKALDLRATPRGAKPTATATGAITATGAVTAARAASAAAGAANGGLGASPTSGTLRRPGRTVLDWLLDPARTAHEEVAILGPNAAVCGLEHGTILSRGLNGEVYPVTAKLVAFPDAGPWILKKATRDAGPFRLSEEENTATHKVCFVPFSTSCQMVASRYTVQQILERFACSVSADGASLQCNVPDIVEVLLGVLASALFEQRVTPHTTLLAQGGVCQDRHLTLLLEQMQVPPSILNNGAGLALLPWLLEALQPGRWLPAGVAPQPTLEGTVFGAGQNVNALLQIVPERAAELREIIDEVLISVLHTQYLLQGEFGIVHFDFSVSNVLLTAPRGDGGNYYRPGGFAKVRYLKYLFACQLPGERSPALRALYLPYRGFLVKVIDFGLAVAQKPAVPAATQTYGPQARPGAPRVIQRVTDNVDISRDWRFLGWLAQQAHGWDGSESEVSAETKIRQLAMMITDEYPDVSDQYAADLAGPALRGEYEQYRDVARYLTHEIEFLGTERGLPLVVNHGYDAQVFAHDFTNTAVGWLQAVSGQVAGAQLTGTLLDFLLATHSGDLQNPETGRPALGHLWSRSPRELLQQLFAIALHSAGPSSLASSSASSTAAYEVPRDGALMAEIVGSAARRFRRYLVRPAGVSDDEIVTIGPVKDIVSTGVPATFSL